MSERDSYLLLSREDRPCYPGDRKCPVCQAESGSGIAYLSAGALLLTEDGQDSIHTDRQRAFLHLGFHGCAPDMRDSADIQVVWDLHRDQFDLYWCSVACMRIWFNQLFDAIEARSLVNDTDDI